MKKNIRLLGWVLMASVIVCLSSCSKDDEDKNASLDFIQVKVYSDDIVAPKGNVYLFYVENYQNELTSYRPSPILDWTPTILYKKNGETEYIGPVSKNGKERDGELLVEKTNGYSVHSIYWSELSSIYGTPKAGGKYVLYVKLKDGLYLKAYKLLTIKRNSLIEVHFPKSSDKSAWVNADFLVSDYE